MKPIDYFHSLTLLFKSVGSYFMLKTFDQNELLEHSYVHYYLKG